MFRVVKLAGIVGLSRELLPLAMLLTLLVPAYSQQEVDPTGYDPWTTASKATVRHLQDGAISGSRAAKQDQFRRRHSCKEEKTANASVE
ncbi:MAG TPA: hypothetical protein VIX37_06995 [Candidatus Sulfotelmatobacter sp.]